MRWLGLVLLVAVSGCLEEVTPEPSYSVTSQAVLKTFGTGSLIIPMDTSGATNQNTGMLRAYGLVYELLRQRVTVHWVIAPGKPAGGIDASAASGTLEDVRTGTAIAGTRDYRGGPFVIDASDATAASPIITAWQATPGDQTAVHRLTSGTLADVEVARTLVAAPRIAVLQDGYESIMFNNLNAAGIPSAAGTAWAAGAPGELTPSSVAGSAVIASDGVLLEVGQPRYCALLTAHYAADATTNDTVAEIRSWLDLGPETHLFAQCEATRTLENAPTGRLLTADGLNDDGSAPSATANRAPAAPLAQLDGAFQTDAGSTDSMKAVVPVTGPAYKPGVTTLINEANAVLSDRIVLLDGRLDGDSSNGRVSYLAGHDYQLALPISSNPQTNGVRILLNALLDSACATTPVGTEPTVQTSSPAYTSASTVTYTVSYANPTARALDQVRVSVALPAGATFVSSSVTPIVTNGTATWSLGTLAAGGAGSLTLEVAVSADGSYPATARLAYASFIVRVVASNTATTVRDTVVPETSILSGPPARTSATSSPLTFQASEASSTFECSLDNGPFVACTSAYVPATLGEGSHTFEVRAIDPAGLVDASPATRSWFVDLTPPDTLLVTTPEVLTISPIGSFTFVSLETPATFECALDGAAYSPCTSPLTTGALPDGSHTLAVRAVDLVGLADPAPASFTWTIDASLPDTTIATAPEATTADRTADFTFTASETATFECSLDGQPFAACTTPYASVALADGEHALEVRARDTAGNTDATPARHTWTVDANDADGDGAFATDNCPLAPNPDQADTDGDGVGDACEEPPPEDGGCGCRSTSRGDGLAFVLLLAGLFVRRRRR